MAAVAGERPPYWVAARLTATARQQWPTFDGWCASRNVDPLVLDIDRFCNLIYFWLTQNVDERRRREIDTQLERVPPGEDPVEDSTWSAEAEMAAFTAAARTSGSVG